MAEHGNSGSEGEVVDRVEDRGGPMEIQMGDQTATEEAASTSAAVAGDGDGGVSQQQEVGDGEKGRATEENPRATVPTGAMESISEAEGPGVVAEGPPMVGGDSEEEKPIEEEQTYEEPPVEIREQDIAFRPPVTAATSSRHVPITYYDIAEHAPDAILARLLEERPDIGELVLKAKEDRARAIEAAEAAERAEREMKDREEPLRDVETEEREAEEALGPRVTVAEAAAARRPDYTAEPYTPPHHICLYHRVFQHTRRSGQRGSSSEGEVEGHHQYLSPSSWRDDSDTSRFRSDHGAESGKRAHPFRLRDTRQLEWFLGDAPKIEEGMAKYEVQEVPEEEGDYRARRNKWPGHTAVSLRATLRSKQRSSTLVLSATERLEGSLHALIGWSKDCYGLHLPGQLFKDREEHCWLLASLGALGLRSPADVSASMQASRLEHPPSCADMESTGTLGEWQEQSLRTWPGAGPLLPVGYCLSRPLAGSGILETE
ncbi:hypothetical protein RHMOL_Rhmol02G0184400 [Rhododendron molle]|uniref:Uncharacterized protein n=1 Tax=Rhododendron molle TaxID=49168 RepID=A0ACC0PRB4_RHOML|nr:hypothetical protein RHMOL_Rhmol02G0184400 [Rhododendron molle]